MISATELTQNYERLNAPYDPNQPLEMLFQQVQDAEALTVTTLTTTNAKLATQLEVAQAQIAQLKNEVADLKNRIKPAWQGQQPIKTTNNDSYCWLHGYQVAKSHTTATCNMKKSGHKDTATKSNHMGGFQWSKE
jgi:type VI protein secretion system component VasK